MHRLKLVRTMICIALMILLVVQLVFANDLKAAKEERLEVNDQIEDTIQEKESKEELIKEKENLITVIQNEIIVNQDLMTDMRSDYTILINDLDIAIQQVTAAAIDFEEKSEAAKQSILRLYKNSRSTYISLVNESGNIFDMIKKIDYIDKIIDSDKEKITEALSAFMELSTKKEIVLEMVRRKNSSIRDLSERLYGLETSRSGVEREITETYDEIAELEQKTDELKEYSLELIEEIKQLQMDSKEYVGGDLLWPVPSSRYIASYFGIRIHPIYKVKKMHNGIDIGTQYYAKIVAANDGIVISSCYITGYGYTVIIDHGGGVATLYAHCSRLKVKKGDLVFKGDLIALAGSSGLSTGPHLHFEVRINGVCKNPLNYLE